MQVHFQINSMSKYKKHQKVFPKERHLKQFICVLMKISLMKLDQVTELKSLVFLELWVSE